MTFTQAFYNQIRDGCRSSAAVVVPVVLDALRPRLRDPLLRVVDIGCGEGWWARAFRDRGCQVLGLDIGHGAGAALDKDEFYPSALDRPIGPEVGGHWDLAVALEVAEHLPAARAPSFIADLCALAPTVLFSAAIPGQGGTGHVNERWPDYWTGLFTDHGYEVSGALRWRIWDDARIEPWYRQNLLVATRLPRLVESLGWEGPLGVVHPAMWEHIRP